MAKKKRRSKVGSQQVEALDSDDEELYSKEEVPDENDESYYYDEVDQFHIKQDKILLEKGASLENDKLDSDQEEVLAFDDDDSDDDDDDDDDNEQYQEMKHRLQQLRRHGFIQEMASDLEEESDKKTEEGDKDKAWGLMKSKFYGGHDSDIDEDISDSEPEAALLEEEEALAIQKRLMQQMDESDVGLDMFKPPASSEGSSSEKVVRDLTKMSHREKRQLLKKQSPELLELIADYKMRVSELQKQLLPVYKLIREKRLPRKTTGAAFVMSKVHVYMNYMINFGYYLMLKAKQVPVEHHPVIKRLLQYRNIIKQVDALEPRFKPALDTLLQKIQAGKELMSGEESSDEESQKSIPVFRSRLLKKKKKAPKLLGRKRLTDILNDSDSDIADPDKDGQIWERKRSKLDKDLEVTEVNSLDPLAKDVKNDADSGDAHQEEKEAEPNETDRRGINYQIEKNKGLTVKKRKENRNPRVKNRMKYRKALIRRRGQVREVRKEIQKYGGEISGIRAGIKKSVKFKS